MDIVLISTYELGRQPFGLASPAAWLRAAGHNVRCVDLSIEQLPEERIQTAGLVAFYLPMHTATRLALRPIQTVKRINPQAILCCYGLYAPLNQHHLRELGVHAILGGEFEAALVGLAQGAPAAPLISLDRLRFRVPDRSDLPELDSYAHLRDANGGSRRAGYTEASRGCKHRCRHCPIVPVYNGAFRIIQADVVLEDIRRQVAAGAGHVTFGDPDFFNGPVHARRIVESLHHDFPHLTYDVTIKVEHLLRHRDLLPILQATGCLFVTTAVESLDDAVLRKLEKGHTRADFECVVEMFRQLGLTLSPTFIPFTPWTTLDSYREFLQSIRDLDLLDAVSPVQLALRLLIPEGSRMLELPDVQAAVQGFDAPALLYRWKHPDLQVDRLAADVMRIAARKKGRRESFAAIWTLAHGTAPREELDLVARAAVPYLDEPWYC